MIVPSQVQSSVQTGKASTSSVVSQSDDLIIVRDSTLKDIAELSVTMRQEDKDEIWHLARSTPHDALKAGFIGGDACKTVLLDGYVVCMFGIGGKKGEVGIPWMLASDLLKDIRKPFVRECKKYLQELSDGYPLLFNVAWSKNSTHVQWLKWLGFEIKPAKPLGPDGELYHEFIKVN